MVEGKTYESRPANWSSFDLKGFSRQKQPKRQAISDEC